MPIYTKVNGVWKEVDTSHVKVGGIYKEVEAVFVNVLGKWKEVDIGGKDVYIITPDLNVTEINKVLNDSTNGVILLFDTGDYQIDQSIKIVHSNTWITGRQGARLLNNMTSGNAVIDGVFPTINNVRNILIKDITIDGQKSKTGYKCIGISIKNIGNKLVDAEEREMHIGGIVGTKPNIDRVGAIVDNCNILNCNGTGINFDNCHYSFIKNSMVSYTTGRGIAVWQSTLVTVKNNKVNRNSGDGIYGNVLTKCQINDNSVDRNSGDGILVGLSRLVIISNNSISYHTANGIRLPYCHGITVTSNKVWGGSGVGLIIDTDTKKCAVIGNNFSNVKNIESVSTSRYNSFCANISVGASKVTIAGTGNLNNNTKTV